jgi:hypothetical protein
MKTINEELFIKNYFSKRKKIVIQEDALLGGLIILGAIAGGFIAQITLTRMRENVEALLKAQYLGDDNAKYNNLASKKNPKDSQYEIIEEYDNINNEIEKMGTKTNASFTKTNKEKIEEIKKIKEQLEIQLAEIQKNIDEEKKPTIDEKKPTVENLEKILALQIELFQEVIKGLDVKEKTPVEIQNILALFLKQATDLGIDPNKLKEELKKVIDNANMSSDKLNKEEAKKALDRFIPEGKAGEVASTEIYNYTLEPKTGSVYGYSLKENKSDGYLRFKKEDNKLILFFKFKNSEDLKNKIKYFQYKNLILFSINFFIQKEDQKDEDSIVLENLNKKNFLINENENNDIQFSIIFIKKQKSWKIETSSVETLNKIIKENNIEDDTNKSKSVKTTKKYNLDLNSINLDHTNKEWKLEDAENGKPNFSVTKNGENFNINFDWQGIEIKKETLDKFQDFLSRGFYFSKIESDGKKVSHYSFESIFLKIFNEETSDMIKPKDFSIIFKKNSDDEFIATDKNTIKFYDSSDATDAKGPENTKDNTDAKSPENTGGTKDKERGDWPEKLYFELERKSLIITSILSKDIPTEKSYLEFSFKEKKDKEDEEAIYLQESISKNENVKKTLLDSIVESLTKFNSSTAGQILVKKEENNYLVSEIISLSKYDNATVFPGNAGSPGSSLFKIVAIASEGKGAVTPIKNILPTKVENTEYWFYIQALEGNNKVIIGVNLFKLSEDESKKLISLLKTIGTLLFKKTKNNNMKISKIKINNFYINLGILKELEINKCLSDLSNLTRILKVLYPENGEIKYSAIKNEKTTTNYSLFSKIGFIKIGSFKENNSFAIKRTSNTNDSSTPTQVTQQNGASNPSSNITTPPPQINQSQNNNTSKLQNTTPLDNKQEVKK